MDASQIYLLKREVLEAKRAAVPLATPLQRLAPRRRRSRSCTRRRRPFFSDISDHLLRVIDHVESYDRLLTDVLSAHLAQISVQQNDDMRTHLGLGGHRRGPDDDRRDLRHELQRTSPSSRPASTSASHEYYYGYFVVLAVMAVVCVSLYRAFRRSGWL